MFRTSYVHHQEDCIVHAALYGLFSCIYASSLSGWRMCFVMFLNPWRNPLLRLVVKNIPPSFCI